MTRRDLEKASTYLTMVRLLTVALSSAVTVIAFVDEKIVSKRDGHGAKADVQKDPDVVQMPQTEAR